MIIIQKVLKQQGILKSRKKKNKFKNNQKTGMNIRLSTLSRDTRDYGSTTLAFACKLKITKI